MPAHRHRRFAVEWLALIAVQLVCGVLVAFGLLREQRGIRSAEVDRLESQAKVVDENLSRQLEGADKALTGIAAAVAPAGPLADVAGLTVQLKLLTDAMPGVSSMFVLGTDGTVVASSSDGRTGRNFAQRDYFEVPRRIGDPSRLYVSPPFHSTYGTYVIVASKVLVDRQQRFAGVVTATLDPDYFQVLLRSVLYAPDMRATIAHGDGAVFLDERGDASAPERPAPDRAAPPDAHKRGTVAEETRLIGLRALDRNQPNHDKPLVAIVSRDVSAVLARWRVWAWQAGGLLMLLALASSGALRLSQRRHSRAGEVAAAIARERRLAAERVEQALHGADLGLWELHVPSDTFVINARERSLLGYAADDELPQGPAWRRLIHPDDQPRVDAAIVPHLKGQAASYECEHRMLHRDGHYVWLFSRAMIVERAANGAPLRIVGTHLEITDRKQAEERLALASARLRDSEEQLRLLTDNMPALVSRLDLDQRFRFGNRAYADWLQIEPASLIGRTLSDVYGAAVYGRIRHHVERALSGVRVVYERSLATPTGPRRVEFTLVPEIDAQGTVNGLYTLATDITARHEAERRQAQSEERLSVALEGSGQVLFDWDLITQTVYQSAKANVLRGEAPAEGVSPVEEMQRNVHPDDLPGLLDSAREAVTGRTPLYQTEFRLLHKAGHWIWIRAMGRVAQRDEAGRALRISGTYADISGHKFEEDRLRRLAEFDTLTGLPNRALFRDRLRQALARAARGKPMALLFLDVDHFKDINDSLGHESGDEVLRVFASRMQSVVRASDTVARLGGDEFTIILEAVRGTADASHIADKLNHVLQQPIALADGNLQVTASIGIALCTPGESDEAALLRRADAALYEAKRRGRNSSFCAELS